MTPLRARVAEVQLAVMLLTRLPAGQMAKATPIGAAVWALLLVHEKVTMPLMVGGLTVIIGLMLYTYGEMKAGKR